MFFPRVRPHAPHVPHVVVPVSLAVVAIGAVVTAWAVFAPGEVGTEVIIIGPDTSSIQSIAYTVPGPQFDDIAVRAASGNGAARVVASFPNGGPTGFHPHGAASPSGNQIAVLWAPPFSTSANLSFVDLPSGRVTHAEGSFESFSSVVWSADGRRLAVTAPAEAADTRSIRVVELAVVSNLANVVAEFTDAIEVQPVGYSFDGGRLFVVVVDPRGSNLWEVRNGKASRIGELSPGRTRDWALSPDGARLAFVDILSGGSRSYVGRTIQIATGAITTLPATKNQVGATWMPGSALPSFGGPGGEWQLTDPTPDGAYLVPEDWSPNGAFLVATVYSETLGPSGRPDTSLELMTRATTSSPSTRQSISAAIGAAFLGWVRNLH